MRRVERLVSLFHHRWAVPLLAELSRRDGERFVTLAHRLEASPGALRLALDDLMEAGWIQPNPGHGHPLRPEYVLTRSGEALGATCERLDAALRALRVGPVAFNKWSMPVLHAVDAGPTRFGEAAAQFPAITDRALAHALKDLASSTLVRRVVRADYPPVPVYAATGRGLKLVPLLAEL